MKKCIFLILSISLLITNSCITDSQQQASEIFTEFEGQKGFVMFRLPPALIQMFIKSDSIPNNKKLIDKLDIIQVVIFNENDNSDKYSNVLKQINNKIQLSDFKLITNINQETENVEIYAISKETQIKEILLMIINDKDIIAVDFVGDMSIQDIVHLADKIDKENIKNFSIH